MADGNTTRQRIEHAALTLFADRGVAATSIRDIARAAGVAEGALYRHFTGKSALARSIFVTHYADVARDVLAITAQELPFAETVGQIVRVFCRLFDDNEPLFAFLMLSQHDHLADVPLVPEENVVVAVKLAFAAAMVRNDIRRQDADLLTAMALGIVAQPAVFVLYRRLEGPLIRYAGEMEHAVIALTR